MAHAPVAPESRLTLTLRPDRTVIERTDGTEAASWDREGRLLSVVTPGRVVRRGISGRFLARPKGGGSGLPLPEGEGKEWIDRALRIAREAEGGRGREEEAGARLRLILARDGAAHEEDARRFRTIWKPIPILPPDRILSLVLQGTEGCPWGRCLFCGLYPEGGFRVKGEEEFARHVREALGFLGRSVLTRNSLFLGDGDPLAAPDRRILPLEDRLLAELDRAERRGDPVPVTRDLYAFARISTLAGRRAASLAAHRRRGLRRLYIGVETGDPELYGALRKPGRLEDLPGAIRAMHDAGIDAGLIFLAGAGGRRFLRAHGEGTLRLIESLHLRRRDLIYLSPLVESPRSGHRAWRKREGIEALPEEEIGAEARLLAERIRRRAGGARTAPYPLRSFVY